MRRRGGTVPAVRRTRDNVAAKPLTRIFHRSAHSDVPTGAISQRAGALYGLFAFHRRLIETLPGFPYNYRPELKRDDSVRAYFMAMGLLLAIFGSIAGTLYFKFAALATADFSPPPVIVAASVAQTETWRNYLDAVGTIRAVRGVDLTSETSGEVTAINFDSGDEVESGQLLLVLNDEVEQASRENQAAALELAQILFERDDELVKKDSVSRSRYDQSRADLARARAQLAETEARLRNKRIHAPFSGSIGIRRVQPGDYISPGTVIATLQDRGELEIDFTLPARYAPELRAGLELAVSVSAFPGRTFKARVTAIDSRVDPGTRNLLLRAGLLENVGLLPGMFATLRIDLDRPRQLVTIPETALTYSLQGNTVFVVEEREGGGLTAMSRIVEVGEVRDGRVAVLAGIDAGERVVSVGQNKLYRGVTILIDPDVKL